MEDNGTENCNINSSVFDTNEYFIVSILSASTALVSSIACIAVVLLVLVLKKYYFFTQRLILYLSLAALLNSLSIVMRYQRFHREDIQGLCIFTAFFDQITAWSELNAISSITINLLLTVIYRKQTTKLEPFYVFMIFVFPLTINWIPFVNNGYGRAGAWCWIRGDDGCSTFLFGTILRYVLWWVPFYVILSILIIIYIIILYYVRRQRHIWDGNYDPESERLKKMTEKEIRPLMWYPLIFFLINIFPFINRLYNTITTDSPILVLWILHAIFSPLQGGFIAVAFTLDKETLRRLNCVRIRAAVWQGRVGKQHSIREYPATEPKGYSDSLRKSGAKINGSSGGEHNGVGTRSREEDVEATITSGESDL